MGLSSVSQLFWTHIDTIGTFVLFYLSHAVQGRAGCVPAVAVVQMSTQNLPSDRNSEYAVDTEVALSNVYLRPGEGVVFRWSVDVAENTCNRAATLAG